MSTSKENFDAIPLTVKKKKRWRIVLSVLFILILIRLALPYILLGFVNQRLATIPGYYGHVEDIELSLLRGAYIVSDIYINKLDSATQTQTSFFSSSLVDLSVEWKSLLKGRIVSELYFTEPVLRFTRDLAEPGQLEKDTNDFRRMLKTFTPLQVNHFEVFDGKIQYVDSTVTPPVDIYLDRAHVLALNLSNVVDTTLLPATVTADADVYGGRIHFSMRIEALAEHPTFDMNTEIENANLVKLNEFFKAYADFDVNKGVFNMYMEIAARDQKFIGYVKPVISDLDIIGPEDRKDSVLRKLWEGLIGVVGDVLENPKSDDIATKIPLAGEYDENTIGIWYAILGVLQNGFIRAIYPALDDQVTIGTVKNVDLEKGKKEGVFKKIFGSPGSNKKK